MINFQVLRCCKIRYSYCRANYHDLHRRDSRTLDAAVRQKRVVPERAGKNRDLKYYEVSYHCVHGYTEAGTTTKHVEMVRGSVRPFSWAVRS